MKIYTKKGDKGTTRLLGVGVEVYKHNPQVEICGMIDELNSHMGLALSHDVGSWSWAEPLCSDLFHMGAELASVTPEHYIEKNGTTITEERILKLEEQIDRMEEKLPELKNFILPVGSVMASQLFVARSIARRLERRMVEYKYEVCEPMGIDVRDEILKYLNRLSDFLFVLARDVNEKRGMPARKPRTINWNPKKDK